MSRSRLLGSLGARLPANWRTVRVRLTAFYGGLFLLAGAALLAIANLLVSRTTGDAFIATVPLDALPSSSPDSQPIQPDRLPVDAQKLQAQLDALHAHDVHQFLIQSVVALSITAVFCVAFGYFIAGRALRPVRAITTKARTITAHNLHERVSVAGPADELKELGDTFDELLDRLDSAFQSQRQFIANASHELRSPLTRQRTITEVALGDPDASAEALRAAHQRVLVAEMQQQRLIDALLTLARGQVGLHQRRQVDLAAITRQVLDTRRDEARRHGITITSSLDPAQTTGDPRLVERLVTNLIDNAIHHNIAHGCVQVGTRTDDAGLARLDVSNTGPLVPPDAVERIFQPFRSVDTDRTHNDAGLGLGLSIVQAIADTHHATISTQVRPEGGLHIRITFQTNGVESPCPGAVTAQNGRHSARSSTSG